MSCTAFIVAKADASLPEHHSSAKPSLTRCSRRRALNAAALSLISLAIRPHRVTAVDAAGVGDAVPVQDFERVRSLVKDDVSFADFVASLQKGDVKTVWFFGTFNQYCCFEANDGVVRHVGEGYPVESSRSPESPFHIVAKVRDSNVAVLYCSNFRQVPAALGRPVLTPAEIS